MKLVEITQTYKYFGESAVHAWRNFLSVCEIFHRNAFLSIQKHLWMLKMKQISLDPLSQFLQFQANNYTASRWKCYAQQGLWHINLDICNLLVIDHICAMISVPQVASQCTFNNNEDKGEPFGNPYRMNLGTDDKWPITTVWAIIVDRKSQ